MNAKLSSTMWRLERFVGMRAFSGSRAGRAEGYGCAIVAVDALQPLHTPTRGAVSLV